MYAARKLPFKRHRRSVLALLVCLAAVPCTFGKKKPAIEAAPLPPQILHATSVYIDNQTNYPEIADKAYTELKSWGRYRVVDSQDKAELVLQFTITQSQTQRDDSDSVSLYNSKTGATTYGTVPGGTSTITWSWTRLKVIDPKTQTVLWADQQVWRRKHSATDQIITSFRSRVDAQAKSNAQ